MVLFVVVLFCIVLLSLYCSATVGEFPCNLNNLLDNDAL